MELRKDAPIVPGQQLGGIAVGTSVVSLANILLQARARGTVDWTLSTFFEATYYLREVAVEIVVDVRNGKVSRLTAREGYVGTLPNGIGIGLRVHDAIQLEPRLYYDEAEELVLCHEIPGVALEVAEIDPVPDRVRDLPVHAISVYVAAVDTAAGQRGIW